VRRVRETALCAFVAALVVAPVAAADVAPAPCVGAGLVAIVPPAATEPTTLGPAITAAATTSADAPTFHDAQYLVDLTNAQAGGAGCVRTSAPGGTHAVSHHWGVFGAVSGDSLRADLVPADGDGSGWRLRTTINGLHAVVLQLRIHSQKGEVPIAIATYDGGEGDAYHFIILSPPSNSSADGIMQLFRSFRRLTTAQAAALRPRVIHVVTAGRGDTVETMARRTADVAPRALFLLLNGMAQSETLKPGERVKIVTYAPGPG